MSKAMKTRMPSGSRKQAAFTMVEIALSIAVVAFGLVAILGVLPTGHQVQKDNREDTIINQEGRYFLEAIGSGAQGLTELSNYVESVTITNATMRRTFSNLVGRQVIGLLSSPKFTFAGTRLLTNNVTAQVRAITGSAAEKALGTGPEIAFRYLMTSEVTPAVPYFPASTNGVSKLDIEQFIRLQQNLHEIRLTFRWPILANGQTGTGRRTFSALVSGRQITNQFGYFFQPYSYR